MCLLEGDVHVLHVLVEASFSELGWTGTEAWKIKQLFAPQGASWLEMQAVSLSRLHIQNQGKFAPLISVPPGPWNMGLWQSLLKEEQGRFPAFPAPPRGGEDSWDCSLHERVSMGPRWGLAMTQGWRKSCSSHCRQGWCPTSAERFAELQHCLNSREDSGRGGASRTLNFSLHSSHQVCGGDCCMHLPCWLSVVWRSSCVIAAEILPNCALHQLQEWEESLLCD